MDGELLSAQEAARRLGVTTTTLYAWLGESDAGLLCLRGQAVTVDYYQSGARGQGRIKIPAGEVDRLLELMRVRPHPALRRPTPIRPTAFPGITVPLGRPR